MAKLSTAAMSSPAADPDLKMKKSQRALPRCASIAAELESTMSEPSVENLTERERACLDHLKQAQDLGVSFAEYCRSFDRHAITRMMHADLGAGCRLH
jgi:translation initiation factor 2B subunit (eIF-2B alpha/beta/delta family)